MDNFKSSNLNYCEHIKAFYDVNPQIKKTDETQFKILTFIKQKLQKFAKCNKNFSDDVHKSPWQCRCLRWEYR